MRMKWVGRLVAVSFAASTTFVWAQVPQDLTPQNVLQQFIVLSIVASQCKPSPLPPEKDVTMGGLAKKMQAKAGMSDADMMQDFQRLSTQIVTPDCETWNKEMLGQVDSLLALAERVP